MSTLDALRRRMEGLAPPCPGRLTVERDAAGLESVYWSAAGRRPIVVKRLRGVSMEDL